jgi:hypothetical protein
MADAVRQHAEQIVQMVMRENPSEGQGTRPSWTAVHYEGETAEQRDARSRAASDRHISNLIQRADRPDPTIPEPETTEGQRAEAERWGRLVGLVHILQNLGWDNNVIDRVRFYDGNRRIPWGLTPTRNFVAEMIGVRDSHLHDHTFTAVRDFVRGNTTPMPSPTVHPQDLEETANLIAAVPYAQRVVALMRRMDELGVPYATRASRAIEFGVPAPRAFVRELFGPMSDPAQHAICVEIQRQPRAAPHDSTDRCIAIARGWRERQICNVLRNLALVSDETIEELDFEDITPFGETATRDGVADWLGIDLDADNVAELMMVQNILQRPFPCEEDFHGYPGTRSFLDPIVGRDANIPVHRRTTYGFTGRPGQIEDEGTCTVCGDPSPSDTRDAAGHRICAGCVDEITPTPIEISNH